MVTSSRRSSCGQSAGHPSRQQDGVLTSRSGIPAPRHLSGSTTPDRPTEQAVSLPQPPWLLPACKTSLIHRERCIGRQDGLLHPGTPVHRPRARCYPLVDFRQSVVVYVPANLQPRQQQGLRPADASGLLGGIWINPVLVGYTSISRFCYRFRSGVWWGSLYPGAHPAGRAQD